MATQQEEANWKLSAEASITTVQTAGNALEKKVNELGDAHTLVSLNQQDINKDMTAQFRNLDKDIIRLNQAGLTHDGVNKT